MTEVILYTDGAASGNPGPGGFGVVLRSGIHRKELSMGFRKTTNNRMELLGVIVGLEALKKPGTVVTVYSDSRYVVDAVDTVTAKIELVLKKDGFLNGKRKDLKGRKILIYGSVF